MTQPTTLDDTLLYNLQSGPETLEAIARVLEFTSESVGALQLAKGMDLDCTADGLQYLLQHFAALVRHATHNCQGEMDKADEDRQRLALLEQWYRQHKPKAGSAAEGESSDSTDLRGGALSLV